MPRKRRKSDEATIRARIEEVLQLILDGGAYPDVVQHAAEKGWNLKERQLREYMGRATDLLVERQERRRKRVIAVHLARREKLFARAVKAGNVRAALAVLADTAKLQNLYADSRELKELLAAFAAQTARLRDLEGRLDAAGPNQNPAPPECPPAGPAGGPGAGDRGPAGGLPG